MSYLKGKLVICRIDVKFYESKLNFRKIINTYIARIYVTLYVKKYDLFYFAF